MNRLLFLKSQEWLLGNSDGNPWNSFEDTISDGFWNIILKSATCTFKIKDRSEYCIFEGEGLDPTQFSCDLAIHSDGPDNENVGLFIRLDERHVFRIDERMIERAHVPSTDTQDNPPFGIFVFQNIELQFYLSSSSQHRDADIAAIRGCVQQIVTSMKRCRMAITMPSIDKESLFKLDSERRKTIRACISSLLQPSPIWSNRIGTDADSTAEFNETLNRLAKAWVCVDTDTVGKEIDEGRKSAMMALDEAVKHSSGAELVEKVTNLSRLISEHDTEAIRLASVVRNGRRKRSRL